MRFGRFALAMTAAATAAAKDIALNTAVDAETTVAALHEVPAGPLPGLHLDVNVKGHVMDVYVAPMNFATTYGIKVSKGDYIHIVVTEMKSGDADVLVARAISPGSVDKRTGIFREDMTIYLRNDEGPLW
jgi:hypothetical protein